jgi:hypothetical protein
MTREISPGLYRHYKGGEYVVHETRAVYSGNGELDGMLMVIYSNLDDVFFVRPLEEFVATIDGPGDLPILRFTRIE